MSKCYILLLRPLLLRQLHSILQEGTFGSQEQLAELNNECLRAATDNASIQSALSQCHRIGRSFLPRVFRTYKNRIYADSNSQIWLLGISTYFLQPDDTCDCLIHDGEMPSCILYHH